MAMGSTRLLRVRLRRTSWEQPRTRPDARRHAGIKGRCAFARTGVSRMHRTPTFVNFVALLITSPIRRRARFGRMGAEQSAEGKGGLASGKWVLALAPAARFSWP